MAESSGYLYLSGLTRVYETSLFDLSYFRRLTENTDRSGFIEDMRDSKYRVYLDKDDPVSGFEDYLCHVYRYYRDRSGSSVFDALLIQNDIQNFINYIKNSEDPETYVKSFVFRDGWWEDDDLPDFFRQVRAKLLKSRKENELENTPSGLIEKISADLAYERWIKRCSSSMIRHFWRYMTDIRNLLANAAGRKGYYLGGGNIGEKYWRDHDISDTVPDKIRVQPYMRYIAGEKDVLKWENRFKGFLGSMIKNMRRAVFGPETAAAYLLSIKEEITNLNTVYTGIKMGLEKEMIEENINLAYV